ncbi:MAG: DUF4143 domain-containing protein, partial [Nitrospirae bacterium]|nr:DUF4143 domain-containing protein [Nitrospirota bacterium]
TGLARQLGNVTEGALFENSVYQSLRGKGKVCYFQKKSGVEIDFILNNKTAFEVKLKPEPKDLKRLNRLAVELGLKEFYLVSKHYTDLKNTIYGFML